MKSYDAIVVGAGPGGSTTAQRLATGGADVLLLDRAEFPRDKPCGGGVTLRAAAQIPVSIDPVVEQVVTIAELGLAYKRKVERGAGDPLVLMTQRSRLDSHLAESAVAAGAEFRDGVKVTAVETDERGATVTAGSERIRAAAVVGADGVNGITARALDLGGNRTVAVALEANVPNAKIDPERWRGRFLMELCAVPGGYGWVFPKGDHVNVGVGGFESEGPEPAQAPGPALRGALGELGRPRGDPRLPASVPRGRLDPGAGTRAARRRRRRADRPAHRRRDVRGVPLGPLRLRRGRPAPGGRGGEPRRLRRRADQAALDAPLGRVEPQGGARPLSRGWRSASRRAASSGRWWRS